MRLPLAVLMLIAACDSTQIGNVRELHLRPTPFEVPAGDYYGVAWISSDAIALAVNDNEGESRLDVVSPAADIRRLFEPPVDPPCVRLTLRGLIRLPTGEIGAARICTRDWAGPPETADLIAIDAETLEIRDLGPTTEPPSWIAWRSDMKAVTYSVGDDLCAMLREREGRDQPLQRSVTVQGSTFDVGVDLTGDSDACPDMGRASYPAYARDDRLAFLASADSGFSGQDLIDLPWSMFVLAPGADPVQILDGVRWPRGLAWLNEDRLVFSGAIGQMRGIWSIRPDGSGLVRTADEEASWLAASPDSSDLVAIREQLTADAWTTSVVSYDLRAIDIAPS